MTQVGNRILARTAVAIFVISEIIERRTGVLIYLEVHRTRRGTVHGIGLQGTVAGDERPVAIAIQLIGNLLMGSALSHGALNQPVGGVVLEQVGAQAADDKGSYRSPKGFILSTVISKAAVIDNWLTT